jgi:hypothetical protein
LRKTHVTPPLAHRISDCILPVEDGIFNMASTTDRMFYGDGRHGEWILRDYIKKIKCTFVGCPNVAEADKVELFGLSLTSTSAAEARFDGLDAAQTATWATLKTAFNTKWPKEVVGGSGEVSTGDVRRDDGTRDAGRRDGGEG